MQKVFTGIPFAGTGNSLFRDKIIVDFRAKRVTFYKRSPNIIGYTTQTMRFKDISSVTLNHRSQYLLFSTVLVESSGGTYSIEAKGFLPADAKEIQRVLTGLRSRYY